MPQRHGPGKADRRAGQDRQMSPALPICWILPIRNRIDMLTTGIKCVARRPARHACKAASPAWPGCFAIPPCSRTFTRLPSFATATVMVSLGTSRSILHRLVHRPLPGGRSRQTSPVRPRLGILRDGRRITIRRRSRNNKRLRTLDPV